MFPIDATDWKFSETSENCQVAHRQMLGKTHFDPEIRVGRNLPHFHTKKIQQKKTMSTLHSKTPPKKNIPNSTWLPPPPRRTSSHPSGLRVSTSRLVSLAQLTSAINGGYHQKEKPQKETFENSKRHRLEGIGVWEVLNVKKAWF